MSCMLNCFKLIEMFYRKRQGKPDMVCLLYELVNSLVLPTCTPSDQTKNFQYFWPSATSNKLLAETKLVYWQLFGVGRLECCPGSNFYRADPFAARDLVSTRYNSTRILAARWALCSGYNCECECDTAASSAGHLLLFFNSAKEVMFSSALVRQLAWLHKNDSICFHKSWWESDRTTEEPVRFWR